MAENPEVVEWCWYFLTEKIMAVHFDDKNFEEEVVKSKIPVLVDFYAEWCGPCKMMGPTIEKLSAEFEGKVKIGKLDIDKNEKSQEFGIQSIPTLILFVNGKASGDPIVGYKSEEDLRKRLEMMLK